LGVVGGIGPLAAATLAALLLLLFGGPYLINLVDVDDGRLVGLRGFENHGD